MTDLTYGQSRDVDRHVQQDLPALFLDSREHEAGVHGHLPPVSEGHGAASVPRSLEDRAGRLPDVAITERGHDCRQETTCQYSHRGTFHKLLDPEVLASREDLAEVIGRELEGVTGRWQGCMSQRQGGDGFYGSSGGRKGSEVLTSERWRSQSACVAAASEPLTEGPRPLPQHRLCHRLGKRSDL